MMAAKQFRHGHSGTPEYNTWTGMKARCLNQSNEDYAIYGGRGITVCREWLDDFASFFAHVGPKPSILHSIDRIDDNGHYEPGNVRWATPVEQGRNTRRNHWLTLDGVTDTLSGWSERTGLKASTIRQRVNGRGWDTRRALTTPLQ